MKQRIEILRCVRRFTRFGSSGVLSEVTSPIVLQYCSEAPAVGPAVHHRKRQPHYAYWQQPAPAPFNRRQRGSYTNQRPYLLTMARPTLKNSIFLWLFTLALSASAHEHHDELTDEQAHAPIDAILWLHICVQALVWGVLFPTGMVLGLSRSRWHVPLQVSLPPSASRHAVARAPT